MNFKKMLLFAVLTVLADTMPAAATDSMTDWHIRPREIIQGKLVPRCPTIWQYKPGAESELEVDNGAAVTAGAERPLWSAQSAKLLHAPKGKTTVVKFKNPPMIQQADGVELWVFGPTGANSQVGFLCTDADGQEMRLKTRSGSGTWAGKSWWGVALGAFPRGTKFPVKVTGIAFTVNPRVKDTAIWFDMLGAFRFEGLEIPDNSKLALPFPTAPEGIRPDGGPDGGKWGVIQSGDTYIFSYAGPDGKLEYRYKPESGTLSDITAVVDGQYTFQVAKDGGLAVKLKRVKFSPADAKNNKPRLLKSELKDNELVTFWRWSRRKNDFDFTLKFSIYKRTLTVVADADEAAVERFDTGFAAGSGIEKPKLFTVSYLNNRWGAPRLLATPHFLMSVFLDWYETNASEFSENLSRLGLKGSAVLGKHSARIMGGAAYQPKSDGTRNKLHERMFITISPELGDILPNIRNPKSPYYDEMTGLVCCTRSYALQGKGDLAKELAFWQKMYDYGAKDIFLRFHCGKFRMPFVTARLNRQLDFNTDIGTDDQMRDFVTELKKLLPRVGPYEDNRIMSPLGQDFRYDYMARWSDGDFSAGYNNNAVCMPPAIDLLQKEFSPKFVAKYGWNACYFDEVTNTPPWGLVNFDARDPGAGMLRSVIRDYGLSSMNMRKYYNGPIWSEGNAMYFWAGMHDIDYGQSNEPKAMPMPDFALTRINPLQVVTGYDLPMSMEPVDFLLANTIVFGHSGYLWDGGKNHIGFGRIGALTQEEFRNVLKSYFMTRQLQTFYLGVPVKKISYFIHDKYVTASEMLRGGLANSGMVRIEYANGLTVYVNRNPEESWSITIAGEKLDLPPNGYAASKPNAILEYSAEKDGARVDYSRGPLYTYMDGRSNVTNFPELTAAQAYVIYHNADGSRDLVPAPFTEAESIGGVDATKVAAFDRAGKELENSVTLEVIDNGNGRFQTIPGAFRYRLR